MTPRTRLISKLAFCLALSAGALASAAKASAQTHLLATVPFAFTADNVSMPAGRYEMFARPDGFLVLTNNGTGETKILRSRPEIGSLNQGASRLIFHRQPGGIYLSQIVTEGSSSRIAMISHPKPNAEMAKSSWEAATFEIASK